SPVPIRLQAQGWLNGKAVPAAMMNPSPLYPEGKGEAIAWMALEAGGSIDEIHVTIKDSRWKGLADVKRPARVEGAGGARRATGAPWVRRVNDEQQRAVSESSQQDSAGFGLVGLLLVPIMFLLVPGYPILQILALVRLQGWPRKLAMFPLFLMIPVY